MSPSFLSYLRTAGDIFKQKLEYDELKGQIQCSLDLCRAAELLSGQFEGN